MQFGKPNRRQRPNGSLKTSGGTAVLRLYRPILRQRNLTQLRAKGITMDIEGKTIWQVAAGNGKDTHYAKQCLQQDVIVFGPGRYGAWPDCEMPMRTNGVSSTHVGIVKRFAENLKPRDIVVLRVGTQQLYGVGEVVGDYDFSEAFSNVQGWDLQHFRRVRWLWHQDGEPELFPVYSLKLGSSVQYLTSPLVRSWLEQLDIPAEAYSRPLSAL